MNIPESAIKPFEPLGIPTVVSTKDLVDRINKAIGREHRRVMLTQEHNRKHRRIAEDICSEARKAGAEHTGYSLDDHHDPRLVIHHIVYSINGVSYGKDIILAR